MVARGLSWSRMEGALEEGIRYLDDHHHLMTVDEERDQFRTFYAYRAPASWAA